MPSDCDDIKCLGPITYYEAHGCRPIYKLDDDCCPEQWACDPDNASRNFHSSGNSYGILGGCAPVFESKTNSGALHESFGTDTKCREYNRKLTFFKYLISSCFDIFIHRCVLLYFAEEPLDVLVKSLKPSLSPSKSLFNNYYNVCNKLLCNKNFFKN